MGMFDYVDYEAACAKCGFHLTADHFQSKDHKCTLSIVSPRKVKHFYASCPACREWNEFKVKVETYRVKRVKPTPDEKDTWLNSR